MMTDLGVMLRDGRKRAGMTLREVSDACGVDFTYISKIENNRERSAPSNALLEKFAALYGLDSDDVFVAAGKCPPDLLERLRTDRAFVYRVRTIPVVAA